METHVTQGDQEEGGNIWIWRIPTPNEMHMDLIVCVIPCVSLGPSDTQGITQDKKDKTIFGKYVYECYLRGQFERQSLWP